MQKDLCWLVSWVETYTLCSVNTHSRFLLYLGGKCFELYKIFRVCLWENSTKVKVKYSLLLLTCKHLKHTQKILCKSKHFPQRYEKKREWVFFWTQCICMLQCYSDRWSKYWVVQKRVSCNYGNQSISTVRRKSHEHCGLLCAAPRT